MTEEEEEEDVVPAVALGMVVKAVARHDEARHRVMESREQLAIPEPGPWVTRAHFLDCCTVAKSAAGS